MKKLFIIFSLLIGLIVVGCRDVQRNPGSAYMPDMAYSRAYETYTDHSQLKDSGINYTNMPVAGTVARGEELPFPYTKDKFGDSVNYIASKQVVNPLPKLAAADLVEAERLYLINCGICHGSKLDGNGPLYKGGDGPYAAAPRNLLDAYSTSMLDGQLFYSITYGKNLMGPYGAQLTRKQRWMIVHYIREQQLKQSTGSKTPAAADSTVKK